MLRFGRLAVLVLVVCAVAACGRAATAPPVPTHPGQSSTPNRGATVGSSKSSGQFCVVLDATFRNESGSGTVDAKLFQAQLLAAKVDATKLVDLAPSGELRSKANALRQKFVAFYDAGAAAGFNPLHPYPEGFAPSQR